ncbi:MAG: putative amidohydrolase [Polaromonas sp.]|nr:putative amidohydrolase [Polaromonas sp.]
MADTSHPIAAGGWDCHAHLFGPYARFPLAEDRSYTPPEALEAQYLALLVRLGLSHGVLVHPSAYGDDYSLLFNALAAQPQLRGVLVAQKDRMAMLPGLRERGIRALRYSHRSGAGANFAGSAAFDDLLAMAGALDDAALHAELWTDCKVLPGIAPAIRKLPVPLVIDHMAMFDVDSGVNDPGFRELLSLLETGKVWVKMCAYRNLFTVDNKDLGEPFHRALLRANPDRLIWGSDWPHLRVAPVPDPAELLALFKRWTGDDALVHNMLVRNPAALYA